MQRREENKAKKRLAAYERKKAAGEIPPEMHELVPWKPPVRPIDFFVLGDICGEEETCLYINPPLSLSFIVSLMPKIIKVAG